MTGDSVARVIGRICSADLQVGVGNVEARTYAHLEVGATIDRNVWYEDDAHLEVGATIDRMTGDSVARAIGKICSADLQVGVGNVDSLKLCSSDRFHFETAKTQRSPTSPSRSRVGADPPTRPVTSNQ